MQTIKAAVWETAELVSRWPLEKHVCSSLSTMLYFRNELNALRLIINTSWGQGFHQWSKKVIPCC